jgi:hypothetical protein
MIAIHHIENISFEQDNIRLVVDGKLYNIPLNLVSEKLAAADAVQRNLFKVSPSGYGIHWPLIDEDLSIEKLLEKAQ